MLPRRVRWAAGTFIFPLSMLLALAVAAPVAASPPGNNGTVKIDAFPWDDHPDNEPHVGCEFEVDFYGFDLGAEIMAEVTFEAHPPTGRGLLLHEENIWIGHDEAGGGTDLDASRRYDLTQALSGYPVHPQQGYHVKLTVNADGSQGADTKHKVFWVGPCDPGTPTVNPPGNPPGNPPAGGALGGNPPSGGTAGSVAGAPVVTLPDTAMSVASTSGLLLAGLVLLGGTTLVAVTVRRSRSRR
jgi:hypothetical protein